MSLLVLRYHRARAGHRGNPARLLNAHFAHIAYGCANRMPGEPLAPRMINVCLCFEAGFYDFYAVVYPLLVRHDLRALLAVDPSCVRDDDVRELLDPLATEVDRAFADPTSGPYCTWSELRRMVASGHVTIAARGPLREAAGTAGPDPANAMDAPQALLATRFSRPVESFVFCDGTCSAPALHAARQRYRFVFGNGGASNQHWNQRLLYRINADEMSSPTAPFSSLRRAHYRARFWWNRLRER